MINRLSTPPIIRIKVPRASRRYEMVVGLEVHVRLATSSKLFCSCPNEFGSNPNANICPVCTGLPGALPVTNENAVDLAIRMGLALNMQINPLSIFARKSYFYPDLPKGFQISQYDLPLASKGSITLNIEGVASVIGITRAHLEEDAGKLVHIGSKGIVGASGALVDLNRAGSPLLEIVSEPELKSSDQAVEYFKSLRDLIVFMGISDGNMEKGSLRCDANISMRPVGSTPLGTKVEVKNLNSFRFLKMALEAEAHRHTSLLSKGEIIRQETRTFNPDTGLTSSMRSKEESDDYRYFPEPDLLPVEISPDRIEGVRKSMPQSPSQKQAHYQALGLSAEIIGVLLGDIALANFFDESLKTVSTSPVAFANWLGNVFIGEMRRAKQSLSSPHIRPEHAAAIFNFIEDRTISPSSGVMLLRKYFSEGGDPKQMVVTEGLAIRHDQDALIACARQVLGQYPSALTDYKSGKHGVSGFLIGRVRIALGGNADIQSIERAVSQLLEEGVAQTKKKAG